MTNQSKKSTILTLIGIAAMILLILTKVTPSSTIAGYSIFVGIPFFFLTEAAGKIRGNESGLRFHTIAADLKKPGVIVWILLPVASAIVTLILGNLLFSGEFLAHVLGRTSAMLSFDKIALLVVQIIIAAFGEEITYRGFFLGKGSKIAPFWVCAVASSAVFAAGHIAAGNIGIVVYDIATIFIDSLFFSVIYQKTGNCVISTISHILGNATGLVVAFVFFL